LFPIFSRLKGARLLSGLRKSIFLTIPLSILGIIFTFFIAKFAVIFIYNVDYLPAVKILQALSILFLIDPLISIFSSFYLSEGRSYFVAKVLIVSTLINILFNYFLIDALLPYGDYFAVFGAVIATIISRVFYLGMFVIGRK
jgi:O-antigen/teichoic acid export membrane protein